MEAGTARIHSMKKRPARLLKCAKATGGRLTNGAGASLSLGACNKTALEHRRAVGLDGRQEPLLVESKMEARLASMNASGMQALCQPSPKLARCLAKMTVNSPAGPGFLHAMETAAQLGPESVLSLEKVRRRKNVKILICTP